MIDLAPTHRPELSDDEAALARQVVAGLHRPTPWIYWLDLLASVVVGWSAFAAACLAPPWSPLMGVAGLVAFLALYRALAFLHELSHQTDSALPGFAFAWDALVGVPLMFPAVLHVGVHVNHHKLGTYGTAQDPEYYRHGGSLSAAVGFLLLNAVLPLLWSARFLLLAPAGLIYRPLGRYLQDHATSLSMSPDYRRDWPMGDRERVVRTELAILAAWSLALSLGATGVLPWRVFAIWALIAGSATGLNALRTLGAHRYCNEGEPLDRVGQLLDSIDTPGGPWTALWAPVGLRYHALHHFFPGIPYHHLGTAHRRLLAVLPADSPYRLTASRSLAASLLALVTDGCRAIQLR